MTKRKGYNPAKHHSGGVGKANYTEHHKVNPKLKSNKEPNIDYQGEETQDSEERRSYAVLFVIVIFTILYLLKIFFAK